MINKELSRHGEEPDMSTLYGEALARLSSYREKHNLSQEDMGNIMGITQSHYSKVEQGTKMISGTALLNLHKYSMDVDQVLTGEETLITELDGYLSNCKSEHRDELIHLFVWLINRGTVMMHKKEEWENVNYSREIELLHMKDWDSKVHDNIWYGIRTIIHHKQEDMAKLLGINIKKYRKMEKKNGIPDAQVLVNLYEKTGIMPSILLEKRITNLNVINHIWERFTPEIKKKLLHILDCAFEILNEN